MNISKTKLIYFLIIFSSLIVACEQNNTRKIHDLIEGGLYSEAEKIARENLAKNPKDSELQRGKSAIMSQSS